MSDVSEGIDNESSEPVALFQGTQDKMTNESYEQVRKWLEESNSEPALDSSFYNLSYDKDSFDTFYDGLRDIGISREPSSSTASDRLNLNKAQAIVKSGDAIDDKNRIHRCDVRSEAKVHVFFDNIEDKVVEYIDKSRIVVGCIAWLTNEKILMALAKKEGVSIIVQKEDFLRPEGGCQSASFCSKMRSLYSNLKPLVKTSKPLLNSFASSLNSNCHDPFEPIRCCGVCEQNNRSSPKMHHKFAVLFKDSFSEPCCVLTGSWNWTYTATRSIENVVCIYDHTIAMAYFQEYVHVLSLSERLDWTSRYIEPEYRIGT